MADARIPADPGLPESVEEMEMRTCGQERITTPHVHSWDSCFLDDPSLSDGELAERSSQVQAEREDSETLPCCAISWGMN